VTDRLATADQSKTNRENTGCAIRTSGQWRATWTPLHLINERLGQESVTNLALISISPDVRIVDDVRPPAYRLAEAKAAPAPTEHDEQVALFAWAEANEGAHPELANLFAIPNGGARHPAVAAQMKAEGVRPGVPDMFLAIRRGRWAGLFVELKRADHSTRPSELQLDWLGRLRAAGYAAFVCYGAAEAQQCIMDYLQQAVRND